MGAAHPSTEPGAARIERAFDRVRSELGVRTAFPDDVLRAADEAAARDPSSAPGRTDRTDLRAVVNIAEAWTLRDRVGASFPATVVDPHRGRVEVQIESPPVRADAARGPHERWLALGERVQVRLTGVSVEEGKTTFELES